MNMNHIINIVIRQVIGRLINHGMKAGFDKAGRISDQRRAARGEPMADQEELSPQERRQRRQERQQARQRRQQMTAARKVGRF